MNNSTKTENLIEKFGGDIISQEYSKNIIGGWWGYGSNGSLTTVSGGPNDWIGFTGVSCNPFYAVTKFTYTANATAIRG